MAERKKSIEHVKGHTREKLTNIIWLIVIFAFVRLFALYSGVGIIWIPIIDPLLLPIASYLKVTDLAAFYNNIFSHVNDFYQSL